MKVTVDFSEDELAEICLVTGDSNWESAVRKLAIDALSLRRRGQVAEKFISGELGSVLEGLEIVQAKETGKLSQRQRARRRH